AGPMSLREVEGAHDVAADRARREQVEEHTDEVEARVLADRSRVADRAAEQAPLVRAEHLASQVQCERPGERHRAHARERPHQVFGVDVDEDVGDDPDADRYAEEPARPPPLEPAPEHRAILTIEAAFAMARAAARYPHRRALLPRLAAGWPAKAARMARGAWHEEVDLVVVGASVGGLAAAVVAADRGCRTIVVERTKELGGGAANEAEMIAAAGSRWQRAAGIDDGPERLAADVLAATHHHVEPELAAALAAQGAPVVAWLADRCRAHVEPFRQPGPAGHSVAPRHRRGDAAARELPGDALPRYAGAARTERAARRPGRRPRESGRPPLRRRDGGEPAARDHRARAAGARRLPALRRAHGGRGARRRPV